MPSIARHGAPLWLTLAVSLAMPAWAQQELTESQNLAGVWAISSSGRYYDGASDDRVRPESEWSGEKLPFTVAGRAAFDANVPTSGPRQVTSKLSPNDLRDQGNPLGLYRGLEYSGNGRFFEFVQAPGQLVQLFSVGRVWRNIYADGRPVPDAVPAGPFWYGHSVGHWEDDTLVVTTVSLDERQWLDGWGTPISADARIEERWRRTAPDELSLTITVIDPTFYTRPWTSLPFHFALQEDGVEPQEIIYAPVDMLNYWEMTLSPSAAEPGDAVVLFDGGNLDHWLLPAGSTWRVVDDSLLSDGGAANQLVSKGTFRDFELNLEFWVDAPANSGVFIRCNDLEAITSGTCYEVNIWDDRPDPAYRSGAVVNFAKPLAQVDTVNRWNTYQIRAQGDRLQIRLNGVLTVNSTDDTFAEGHITLQYGGSGVVKFRNITLQPF